MTAMSPRVRDARALRDFWAVERDTPALVATSFGMSNNSIVCGMVWHCVW